MSVQRRHQIMISHMICCGWNPTTSVLFHLTMRYWAELADELPMLVLGTSFLVCQQWTHGWTSHGYHLPFYVCVFAAIFSAAIIYVYVHVYEIFVHVFTAIVALSIGLGVTAAPTHPFSRAIMWRGIACIALGRIFWETEQNLCVRGPKLHALWWMHMVWHVFSYSWVSEP